MVKLKLEVKKLVTFTLEVYAERERVSFQHLTSFIIKLAPSRWPSSLLLEN